MAEDEELEEEAEAASFYAYGDEAKHEMHVLVLEPGETMLRRYVQITGDWSVASRTKVEDIVYALNETGISVPAPEKKRTVFNEPC